MGSFNFAWLAGLRLALACCALALGSAAHAEPAAVAVDARTAIALWPAVTLLADPSHALTLEQVLAQPERFHRHTGTPGNLGREPAAIWLRVPLTVAGQQVQHRLLEIDYPALNRVDAYLLHAGQATLHHRVGSALHYAERPLPSRSLAVAYTLQPGDSLLLLRVETLSSMVLPLSLRTPEDFTAHESQGQILQGLIAGLALCMLIYSLAHWVSLRDRSFIDYALMLGGNLVFTLAQFGIGGQYLWPDWPALSIYISPPAVLVAVVGGASFMRSVLQVHEVSRALDGVLRLAGMLALLGLAASLSPLLDYRALQTLATALGLITTAAVLPAACVQAWRRRAVALYMLAGWAFYVCGAITTAGLLRGLVEPTFWAQYLYPLATLAEMSAWMVVLSLRVQSIHRDADRARLESEALRTMAHTDPLTGLINRRGLQEQLAQALKQATVQHPVAIYLVDLDGFKPVNDRHGHDVGDALLVAVGQRLQSQVRHSDGVARLGGDEFVVLAHGLDSDAAARALGEKLVASFDAPFDALGYRCTVGLTAGYALAPQDGVTSESLLKRADQAMYAGKQAGRGRVQRAGAALEAQNSPAATV
jgi:diguanylate cyclase (GGDEF)-like protein